MAFSQSCNNSTYRCPDQNKLVDAAIAAGVKRFVPSEFGSDVPNKRTREVVPIFEGKHAAVEYLKSKESEISWTAVVNGPCKYSKSHPMRHVHSGLH